MHFMQYAVSCVIVCTFLVGAKTVTLRPDSLPPPIDGILSLGIQYYVFYQNVLPGDTVLVKAGTIQLDGPLYVCDSLTIRGELGSCGEKLATLKRAASFHWEKYNSYYWENDTGWLYGTRLGDNDLTGLIAQCHGHMTNSGVTVRDLNIEGNRYQDADTTHTNGLSLVILSGSRNQVVNCDVRHSYHMGIVILGGSDNSVVGCNVFNTARDGIYVGGYRNILVQHNIVKRTRDNAIGFDCNNVKANHDDNYYASGGRASFISDNIIDNSDTAGYCPGSVPGYNRADANYLNSTLFLYTRFSAIVC